MSLFYYSLEVHMSSIESTHMFNQTLDVIYFVEYTLINIHQPYGRHRDGEHYLYTFTGSGVQL